MSSKTRNVIRLDRYGSNAQADRLAEESAMEIRLGDAPIAVVMRTPGSDVDLATGFLLTEGIMLSPTEIHSIEPLDENRWRVEPVAGVTIDPDQFRRNLFATSSCGICGKASIDAVMISAPPPPVGPKITLDGLFEMASRFRGQQPVFDETGGLHAAGIFHPDGTCLAVAEDIGRHNAVDKAIGRCAQTIGWPLGEVVMIVSGRSSFEVAQKAAVAGIPIVAGVSAASTLAAELADDLGMTLIGFMRDGGVVVYSGADRIMA